MDNDDAIIGRVLSRREVLGLMGVAGAALIVGCSSDDDGGTAATATRGAATQAPTSPATAGGNASPTAATTSVPSCVVKPALTEGPYFVDEKLQRSDIRSDPSDGSVRDGTPLTLAFVVSQVGSGGTCDALEGASVDIWHCDAQGVYSDVSDPGFNTKGQKWLRGYQVTDAQGRAQFTTIYPGWYQGRATHIHFKIRTPDGSGEFTSQLFFDDALSDQVQSQGAYASKGVSGRLQNSRDGIFQQSDGQLTLAPTQSGSGYAATVEIGVQI